MSDPSLSDIDLKIKWLGSVLPLIESKMFFRAETILRRQVQGRKHKASFWHSKSSVQIQPSFS